MNYENKRSFHVVYDIVSKDDFNDIKEESKEQWAFENIHSRCDLVNADTKEQAEKKILSKYQNSNYHVFNFDVVEIGVILYE